MKGEGMFHLHPPLSRGQREDGFPLLREQESVGEWRDWIPAFAGMTDVGRGRRMDSRVRGNDEERGGNDEERGGNDGRHSTLRQAQGERM